jgi:hypothetical protein
MPCAVTVWRHACRPGRPGTPLYLCAALAAKRVGIERSGAASCVWSVGFWALAYVPYP